MADWIAARVGFRLSYWSIERQNTTWTACCSRDSCLIDEFRRLRRLSDAGSANRRFESSLPSRIVVLLRNQADSAVMRVPGASLLELKRQGGWQRWEQVERYSHAVPHHDRRTLPNPLQKTAFGQLPSTRVSRLSVG